MSERIFVSTTIPAGDIIANTASATTFATQMILGCQTPARGGQTVRVSLYGTISTDATPGTLTINVNNNAVVLGTTGAFNPPASLSAAPFCLEGFMVNSTTASLLMTFFGKLTIQGASNAPFMVGIVPTGMASGGTTGWATVSLAASQQDLNVSATWSSALATNIICGAFFYEVVI